MAMQRPSPLEYDPYYEGYVSLVPDGDIISILAAQPTELQDALMALPEEKGDFAYAEGKWTIKELLGHIIDGERIFGYRILRVSRGDATPIEGFDQEIYIENARSNTRSFGELLEEFNLVRRANLMAMNHYTDEDWSRTGVANNAAVSTRALAYIMAGHVRHHLRVLQDHYLAAG
jgi:uncharacterized damage-inducible protein DinB